MNALAQHDSSSGESTPAFTVLGHGGSDVHQGAIRRLSGRATPGALPGVLLGLERVGFLSGADADTCFRIGDIIAKGVSFGVAIRQIIIDAHGPLSFRYPAPTSTLPAYHHAAVRGTIRGLELQVFEFLIHWWGLLCVAAGNPIIVGDES
jgi:hypothetical protein